MRFAHYALRPVLIAAMAALATLAPITASAAVGVSPVVINEVESSGGDPGDWVELKNTGSTSIDISGWVVKDNKDEDSFTVPDGTVLPAGGYYVADVEPAFGLGKSDQARLFDGSTLVDEYSWATHAVTSYGRCPDGTGDVTATASSTKGAANDCGVAAPQDLVINEVESNGDLVGDWVELKNTGAAALDISGFKLIDSDPTHDFALIPDGTSIAAGGYYVVSAATLGFGLGSADSATLYATDSITEIDSYSWTEHAATSYGRCPDGTGNVTTTTSSTMGAANDCSAPVKINEIESKDGDPGDWVELKNVGSKPVDISGWAVKDNDDAHSFTIATATVLEPGSYYVAEVDASFGLGGVDSARLVDNGDTLIDSYSWTEHAATSYGRCPDGTGDFTTTSESTKGAANICPGEIVTETWPGSATMADVDAAGYFGNNLSGLTYAGSGTTAAGTLWGVRNGPGTLYKMSWDSATTTWVSADSGDWAAGKNLNYSTGVGDPDAEGVTLGPDGMVYVATERDNDSGGTSRPSVLRFDPNTPGTSLNATADWNLTADLPKVAPNSGLEAITWIPDSYLMANGFVDVNTSMPYQPSNYPGHGSGLFFVGLEANGEIYAYALNTDGSYNRISNFASGFPGVMELQFDPERQQLWAMCDDACDGQYALMSIAGAATASAAVPFGFAADAPDFIATASTPGAFVADTYLSRPAGTPNYANEGFVMASQSECVNGVKPIYWADDSGTGGHSLRMGTVACTVAAARGGSSPSSPSSPSTTGSSGTLPATGADTSWLLLVVATALVLGGTAVLLRRQHVH